MLKFLKKAWKLWWDLLSCDWADRLAKNYPNWADGFYSFFLFVGLVVLTCADLDFRYYSWHGVVSYVIAAVRILTGLLSASGAIVVAHMIPKILKGSRQAPQGSLETPHPDS